MKRLLACVAVLVPLAGWAGDDDDRACTWTQWGQSAAHDGETCVRAQEPRRELAHIVYDPFENQEMVEGGGDLFVHYQAPLSDDDGNFYMMHKAGTYTSCDPPGSGDPFPCGFDQANIDQEVWTEKAYHLGADGTLAEKWTFASDWKPYPVFTVFEPMFQPAMWGPFIYVPGAGGTVWQVAKGTGIALQQINPFPAVDPNTYVSGGITIDRLGFVYWNVISFSFETFTNVGYVVKAAPWGATKMVATADITPGAPQPFDPCYYSFEFADPVPDRPWPPPGQLPPQFSCGGQRPGVNVTPAIGPDGTVFTATADDFNSRYSYLIALHPDLSLKWATSLRGVVNDACGHIIPTPKHGDLTSDCQPGTPDGVEPSTGLPPALSVDDASSSSPVALPDGGVIYGALDFYNGGRGHLIKLDRNGHADAAYGFGWDSTPAIYRHDDTYSVVIKDNHYATDGPYYITQLSRHLHIEWRFKNTETQACVREPDGTLSCSDTTADGQAHPHGFEWCVNAPAIDRDGNVVANSEDGYIYVIRQGGHLRERTFLNEALGAAYTPTAIDSRGRIFALNNGELSILGR